MKKSIAKIKKTLEKKVAGLGLTKNSPKPSEDVLIVTHATNFHPDDVCATATALLYYGVDKTGLGKFLHGYNEIKEKHSGELVRVVRTLDRAVMDKATVLMDIGREYDEKRNRFDHHQEGGAGRREGEGTPYSSFGLVWKKFGKKIVGNQQVADYVDRMMVKQIDAKDNGIDIAKSLFEDNAPVLLFEDFINFDRDLVYSLNLEEKEMNKVFDKTFFKLIPVAQKMIIMTALKGYAIVEAEKKLESVCNKAVDKRLIILDKKIPVKLSKYKEPLLMIYPHGRGVWAVQTVRVNEGSYESRIYLPKSWAGKVDEELQKVTGISDATFCHTGRFLFTAKSKEGALKAAELILKEAGLQGINSKN